MACSRGQNGESAPKRRKVLAGVPVVSDVPVVLRISFDWGTATLNSAFHIAPSGQRAKMEEIHPVDFGRNQHHAPMIGGWLENGNFSCGYELEGALTTEDASYEDVIRLVKLALYDSHKTSTLVKNITEQLDAHDIDLTTFVAKHLRHCYVEVIEYIKRTWINETHKIDDLQKEIYISVPQMWNPSSCKIMMDAAKMAGFPKTELVPEPLCAAAYTNEGMKTFGQHYADAMRYSELKPGDVMQVADLGGGTGDFTSYELLEAGTQGAEAGLRAVGTPQGALCGSEFINLEFLKWVETCPAVRKRNGILNTCRSMGLTRAAFDAKASAAFEQIKTKYPWATAEVLTFAGANPLEDAIVITVPKNFLILWFNNLIDDVIIRQMDKQIRSVKADVKADTKLIIVPGGFGSSKYLMDRLRAHYDPPGAQIRKRIKIYDNLRIEGQPYNPVPTGLLLYFKQIIQRGVPALFTFGVAQVEEFDAELHPDAAYHNGDRRSDGSMVYATIANRDIVMGDPVDSDMDIVLNRFVTLVSKGSLTKPGENAADVSKWQMQYIDLGQQGDFTTVVYWTERDIEDHDPIFDRDGKLLPGIHEWTTSTVKFDPAANGFRLQKRRDGKQVYEVWWNLSLVLEGANASIKWQIMKAGRNPYGKNKVFKDQLRDRDVLRQEVLTIAEEEYNPFVRG